jgi:hypothetical protein
MQKMDQGRSNSQAVVRWAHIRLSGRWFDPTLRNKVLPLAGLFIVMYTVYVLYSSLYDKIYIGYTSNLEARLLHIMCLAKRAGQ